MLAPCPAVPRPPCSLLGRGTPRSPEDPHSVYSRRPTQAPGGWGWDPAGAQRGSWKEVGPVGRTPLALMPVFPAWHRGLGECSQCTEGWWLGTLLEPRVARVCVPETPGDKEQDGEGSVEECQEEDEPCSALWHLVPARCHGPGWSGTGRCTTRSSASADRTAVPFTAHSRWILEAPSLKALAPGSGMSLLSLEKRLKQRERKGAPILNWALKTQRAGLPAGWLFSKVQVSGYGEKDLHKLLSAASQSWFMNLEQRRMSCPAQPSPSECTPRTKTCEP